MKWFDRLFDTYQKRIVMVFMMLLIIMIIFSMNNYRLGVLLSKIKTIEDLFLLVDNEVVQKTFIGSFLQDYLDKAVSPIWLIIKNITFSRFVFVLISSLVLISNFDDHKLNLNKKVYILLLLIYFVQHLLVVIYGIKVLSAQNTIMGITNLNLIGSIYQYSSLLIMIGCISIIVMFLYQMVDSNTN